MDDIYGTHWKKKGFVLLEVSFGIAFAGAAILGFFAFINHLNLITERTLNSVKIIENLPIYYSNIVIDKNSKIENFNSNLLEKISFDSINISEFKDLKNFKGIFIKTEKTSDFFYLNYNNFLKPEEEK